MQHIVVRLRYKFFSGVISWCPRDHMGLGLALTVELAQLLGGDISVPSRPNLNTTFTLILPLTENAPNVDLP